MISLLSSKQFNPEKVFPFVDRHLGVCFAVLFCLFVLFKVKRAVKLLSCFSQCYDQVWLYKQKLLKVRHFQDWKHYFCRCLQYNGFIRLPFTHRNGNYHPLKISNFWNWHLPINIVLSYVYVHLYIYMYINTYSHTQAERYLTARNWNSGKNN